MSENGAGGLPEGLSIRCTGLGKQYTLGWELSLQHTLNTIVRRGGDLEKFWALKDVSFEVPRGEFFGIVGANGSGKSTLTALVSGIAVPDTGRIEVRGRVLPLLELGAGFNGDLTGRENVLLLGAILGLQPSAVRAEIDRIAAFAGPQVQRHLDSPLKRYSSGMSARLGFATAVCFPADVYIFDEVLSVVDDSFRARCAEELHRLNEKGCTVLFMSHDLNLVRSLCSAGMLLERGRVKFTGPMDEVAEAYSSAPVVDAR
jgi:ABC-type polysaccharide/polyol phosphate transport system ATPase subunit